MTPMFTRAGWIVAGALALTVIATLTGVIHAGSLDPPAGAPAPTMRTLNEVQPTWDQTLPANNGSPGPVPTVGCNSTRFTCVLGLFMANATAVLDNETGLVWQASPSTTSTTDWGTAVATCVDATTGGRKGWRLPTSEELLSLVDPSVSPGPTLPAGNPFTNVQGSPNSGGFYWTITTEATNASFAEVVQFSNGSSGLSTKSAGGLGFVWCVRGGHGYDGP